MSMGERECLQKWGHETVSQEEREKSVYVVVKSKQDEDDSSRSMEGSRQCQSLLKMNDGQHEEEEDSCDSVVFTCVGWDGTSNGAFSCFYCSSSFYSAILLLLHLTSLNFTCLILDTIATSHFLSSVEKRQPSFKSHTTLKTRRGKKDIEEEDRKERIWPRG